MKACNLHPTGPYAGSFERCPWCSVPRGAPDASLTRAKVSPPVSAACDLKEGDLLTVKGVDCVAVYFEVYADGAEYVWVAGVPPGRRTPAIRKMLVKDAVRR